MPTVYKVLGQSAPATTSNADAYTVGAGKSAVVSTIAIANVTGSSCTAQIYVRIAGATAAISNAIAYNTAISANSTVALSLGITLAATDVLTVQSSVANALTFTVFGSEIS